MKFSQRLGLTPFKTELEREGMSMVLRNTLWSLMYNYIDGISFDNICTYYESLWINFYKEPVDDIRLKDDKYQVNNFNLHAIKSWFYKAKWFEVFDFIEFSIGRDYTQQNLFNKYLERERSAYRFIGGTLSEIDSKEEVKELNAALENSSAYKSVKTHLKKAIGLYSDRKNPDYRNSIKESISAVEAIAKIIVNDDKATLGKALTEIERKYKLPKSLKKAFSTLYGYTSDEGGIRHSLQEDTTEVGIAEARFMLVACSAFTNYLINIK